ncbi:unnamed protein product, partial [Bubo scandiacus]
LLTQSINFLCSQMQTCLLSSFSLTFLQSSAYTVGVSVKILHNKFYILINSS